MRHYYLVIDIAETGRSERPAVCTQVAHPSWDAARASRTLCVVYPTCFLTLCTVLYSPCALPYSNDSPAGRGFLGLARSPDRARSPSSSRGAVFCQTSFIPGPEPSDFQNCVFGLGLRLLYNITSCEACGRRAGLEPSGLHRATEPGYGPGCGPGCGWAWRPRSGWPAAGASEFENADISLALMLCSAAATVIIVVVVTAASKSATNVLKADESYAPKRQASGAPEGVSEARGARAHLG
jgi:hypothetical protein